MKGKKIKGTPGVEQVREMIALRAYEIYQLRGFQPGHEAEDWFQAEKEILAALNNGAARDDAAIIKPKAAKKAPALRAAKKRTRKQPVDSIA